MHADNYNFSDKPTVLRNNNVLTWFDNLISESHNYNSLRYIIENYNK